MFLSNMISQVCAEGPFCLNVCEERGGVVVEHPNREIRHAFDSHWRQRVV